MDQQDFDFFATGRSRPASSDPVDTAAGPDIPGVAPDLPATPPGVQPPSGRGFVGPAGTVVNQFGTPLGVAAAPVGPNAAPGYTPEKFDGYGVNGTDPLPSHLPMRPAVAASPSSKPGLVVGAGVLAIVQGALSLYGSIAAMALLSFSESLLESAGVSGALPSWLRPVIVLGIVVSVAILALAIAVLVGSRPAAHALIWAELTTLVLGVVSVVATISGGVSPQSLIGLAIPAIVIFLLTRPEAKAWLTAR